MTDRSYTTINNVNALYHIINKVNGYIDASNGNEYLMLAKTNKKSRNNYVTKLEIFLDQ